MATNRSPDGSLPEEPTMQKTAPLNPWWMAEELIFPGPAPQAPRPSQPRRADGLEPTTRQLPLIEKNERRRDEGP